MINPLTSIGPNYLNDQSINTTKKLNFDHQNFSYKRKLGSNKSFFATIFFVAKRFNR